MRVGHNKFLLGSLAMGHLTNDWVAGTIWILAPAIAASMGLGPAEVGVLLTINGLGAGLAYIPAGVLADRASRPGLLMLITFWWVAIGYFCATLVPGFWAVTLLLAFGAMGDAFWHPVATGVLVKTMPRRRAQVLGIHAMGGSVGAEVLGPISAGFLLGYFDWQTSLQILVFPAVLMGIVFIPIAKRIGASTQKKMSAIDFKNLLRRWSTIQGAQLVMLMVLYNMSMMAILAMTPLFLQTQHALDAFTTSMIFASMLLIGTIFQPFVGKFSDRVGRKSIILGGLLIAAVFSLFAGLSSSLLLFVATMLIAVLVLTAVRPVVLATAVEFSTGSEATTLGIVFATLDGVGALGALCAGFVGEIELSYVYFLVAIFATSSAVFCVRFGFTSSTRSQSGIV
jgi:MFS family permease